MEEDQIYQANNNQYIVRYQERESKEVKFVTVIGSSPEFALGTFKRLVTDYIDETPTIITREDYREIRENLGLNPDGIDESEVPEPLKKVMKIMNSKEWKNYYASGGMEDY